MIFRVYRISINSGGYDVQGNYFGIGLPLFRYESEDGEIYDHIRASDRSEAKEKIQEKHKGAKFRR